MNKSQSDSVVEEQSCWKGVFWAKKEFIGIMAIFHFTTGKPIQYLFLFTIQGGR